MQMYGLKTKSTKKSGFTLIELLAVIVILAIIAMIAVPTVLSIIEKARKGAFRNSVYGLMEAADIYLASENTGSEDVEFLCNGETCSANGHALDVKGTVPLSGSIKSNGGDILANFIRNGEYCALGTRNNLDIKKDCDSLDYTPAEIDVKVIRETSKDIIVTLDLKDAESNIKKMTYKLTDVTSEEKVIESEEKSYDGDKSIETATLSFDELDSNHSYKLEIKVVNGNNIDSETTVNLKTREIDNPKFTFEGVPATDQNGYFKSQKINVQYADDATPDTALNYVMTTRNGKSNIKVTKKCETIQETNTPNVASCSDIENGGTNDLVANQWYEIPKDANLSITYDVQATETATLRASTYDGKNYSGTSDYVVSKIDTTAPNLSDVAVTQKTNSLLFTFTATDGESGVATPTCKYGTSQNNLDKDGVVSGNFSCSITGLDQKTTYYYEICAADLVGNQGVCKSGSTATKEVTNPQFTSTKTPTEAIGGFVIKETVGITFATDIDNPNHYILTTKTGTTNKDVDVICENNNDTNTPNIDSCKKLESGTKNLEPDKWYKVDGPIEITYDTPTENNATLKAITYDEKNYTGTSNATLLKIFYDSANVTYTNTTAGSGVTNVKQALDYVYGKLG